MKKLYIFIFHQTKLFLSVLLKFNKIQECFIFAISIDSSSFHNAFCNCLLCQNGFVKGSVIMLIMFWMPLSHCSKSLVKTQVLFEMKLVMSTQSTCWHSYCFYMFATKITHFKCIIEKALYHRRKALSYLVRDLCLMGCLLCSLH